MSDKFILTGELQVRLGAQVNKTIDDFRKKAGKIALGVSIDRKSFDTDSKYILASYKELAKSIKKTPLVVSFSRKDVDADTKYILASFRNIKKAIEKNPIRGAFQRTDIDNDIKYLLASFRSVKKSIESKPIIAGFSRLDIDNDIKYILSSFRNTKASIESKKIQTGFNRAGIDGDIKYILSSVRSLFASLTGRNSTVRIMADIDPAFQQFQQSLNAIRNTNIRINLPTRASNLSRFAALATNINGLAGAVSAFNLQQFNAFTNAVANGSTALGGLSNLARRRFNFNFTFRNARILNQLVTTLNNITTAFNRAEHAGTNFRQVLDGIAQSIQAIGRGRISFGLGGIRNQVAQQQNLRAAVQDTTGSIEELGYQTAITFRRFGAYTLATAGFFQLSFAVKAAIGEFIGYEQELTKVRQVTGQSLTTTEGLSRAIGDLATSYGVSSSKILNTSLVLAQAGFTTREVTEALEALTKTELAATFDDIEKTVEGAIAGMAQFNYETSQLDEVLSSVNSVSAKFAVESEDIITAIQKTGGAFAAAGGNLNELQALFTAVRATTRESADTIATGFRTIFTRLQRVRTQEFLRNFGIDLNYTAEEAKKFGKTAGEFVGPYEAINRLNAALSQLGTTDPRFAQITEELGGFRQISKVIPLIQQFPKAMEVLNVAQKSNNSLTEDAIIAQESFANQLTKVREEFLLVIREFGQDQDIKAIIKLFIGLADSLVDVIRYTKEAIPLFGALALVSAAPIGGRFLSGMLSRTRPNGPGGEGGRGLGGAAALAAGGNNRNGNRTLVDSIVAGTALSVISAGANQTTDPKMKEFGENLSGLSSSLISAVIQFRLLNIGLESSRGLFSRLNRTVNGGARERSIENSRNAVTNYRTEQDRLRQMEPATNRARQRIEAERLIRQQIQQTNQQLIAQFRNPNTTGQQQLSLQTRIIGGQNRINRSRFIEGQAQQRVNLYDNQVTAVSNAALERQRARAERQRLRRRERFAQSAASVGGALAIGGGILSQGISDLSTKQLDKFRDGGSNVNKESARTSAIAGGAIGGGLAGAGAGFFIGAQLGPAGAAIGAAAGLLVGAAKGYVDGTEEFKKAVSLIEVGKIGDALEKRLKNISEGKTTASLAAPDVLGNLTKLRNKLQSTSDPEVRQDINATLDNSSIELDKFVRQLADGSGSLSNFNQRINDGTKRFIASIIGIPYEELNKQIEQQIENTRKAREAADRQGVARSEFESQIRSLLQLRQAFAYAESKINNFGDSIKEFLSGSTGSTRVKPGFSGVSGIDLVPDIGEFSKEITQFTGQFGPAGKEIGGFVSSAAKAVNLLPDIFLKLKAKGSFASESDLSNTLSNELDAARISGAIKKVIEAKLPTVLGQDFKDSEFFKKLDEDFPAVLKTFTDGFKDSLDLLIDSANKSSEQLQIFGDNLATLREAETKAILDNAGLQDFNAKLSDSRSTFASQRPDFAALLGFEDARANTITGGKSIDDLKAQRLASSAKVLSLKTEIDNERDNAARQVLIKAKDAEHAQIERTTQALKFLAENTNKLSILQTQLNIAQSDRLKSKDFAIDSVFGDRQTQRQQRMVLIAAQNVATSGNADTAPDALKQEVLALFRSFGDALVPGTNVTGNQAINQGLANAGISPDIIGPGQKEKDIQALIEEQITNAAKAQTSINELLATDRLEFSKVIHTEFSEFLKNLNSTLNASLAKDFTSKISTNEADLKKKQSDLAFIQSVGTPGINNIDSIAAFEKEQKANKDLPKTLEQKLAGVTGLLEFSGDRRKVSDLNKDLNLGVEGLPAEVQNRIKEKVLKSDIGLNATTQTFDSAKLYSSVYDEIKKELDSATLKSSELQGKREELVKNVGGENQYQALAKSALEIQQRAASLQSKDAQALATEINNLSKNIEELRKQKAALGFNAGGIVPGSGNYDSVPARLTPGEGVITKSAMKTYGSGIVHALNNKKFPQNFASGGVVGNNISIDGESLSRFNAVVQNLANQIDRMQAAFSTIPSEITLNGRHTVEVIINGAQVLTSIQPEIAKLVEYGVKDGINRMLKSKFPNVGSYN